MESLWGWASVLWWMAFRKRGSQVSRCTSWEKGNWSPLLMSPCTSRTRCLPTDSRMFVHSNPLMKVPGCITNIICITQITRKSLSTNNGMLTYNTRLNFFSVKILLQFFARKLAVNWRQSYCWAHVIRCLRTTLAAILSLKPGRTVLIALPSSVFFSVLVAIVWINIMINGGIYEANWIIKSWEYRDSIERNMSYFSSKASVVDDKALARYNVVVNKSVFVTFVYVAL